MENKQEKLFIISHTYLDHPATLMEKELAKFFSRLEDCLTYLSDIEAIVEEAKKLQEEILLEYPRRRPVDINFKYRNPGSFLTEYITFGNNHVALKEVRFFVDEEKLADLRQELAK